MSAGDYDGVGYHSVVFRDHLRYHAPLASNIPAVSGYTAPQQRDTANSLMPARVPEASIPRNQDNNVGHQTVRSPQSPNDGLTASRAILVCSQHSEAEGYISELPATVAESQDDITGSTPTTTAKEPRNSQSGHLLIGYVAVSLSAKSGAEQAGSDGAQADVRGARDSDGSSTRNSFDPPNVVPTGGSTRELLPRVIPKEQTMENTSRKRRYAETGDNSEEASHTLNPSPSPRKRPKMEPVEIGRTSAQEGDTEMKLLPSQVPGPGLHRPTRVLRSIKSSRSAKPSKTLGQNQMLNQPQAMSPASPRLIARTNGKKRGYVETHSDYDQQAEVGNPLKVGLKIASPPPMQQKEQPRCNKRARKSHIADSSTSTRPAARTDHIAERTRINDWMDRNTETEREKQHQQRERMLEAMS